MVVLAIESTCDETGCAIAQLNRGLVEILADIKASSAEILSHYGGIIPEIAAREQVTSIIPVVETAIQKSGIRIQEIDAVAVTNGPGLIGSLLIGVETAKTLSLAWKKPLIAVNHMAGHVFANWIKPSTGSDTVTLLHSDTPEIPALALIVSGGHTDLILLKSLTEWEWVGGTRDDAAGEAFDKAARALGFPYPGGPAIARAAMEASNSNLQLPKEMKLPRPMIHEPNLEMSFSGLKTALVQVISAKGEKGLSKEETCLLAAEFNEAVVEVLIKKTMMAVEQYQPKSVLLAGGVAANRLLREQLQLSISNYQFPIRVFVPDLRYCSDNAAMIAACALMKPNYIDPLTLKPDSGLVVN